MKYFPFLFTLVLFASCNNDQMDLIKSENEELKAENDILKAQLEDAFVIPYDSLTRYMIPFTFGMPEMKVNEKGVYTTCLAWTKFPEGVDFKWEVTNGNGVIKKDYGAYKHVEFEYPTPGEKEEMGSYLLTLPTGEVKELVWIWPTVVK